MTQHDQTAKQTQRNRVLRISSDLLGVAALGLAAGTGCDLSYREATGWTGVEWVAES